MAVLSFSCGYRAVYGNGEAERLHVTLSRSLLPYAVASDEVVSGAREELAREGALASGDGYPRIEIEVLRADESSEGIDAVSGQPRARATEVGLVARAWLVRERDAPRERDTGDVRAMDLLGVDLRAGELDSRRDAFLHDAALRSLARRVGKRLAARILGNPVAVDEGIGRER